MDCHPIGRSVWRDVRENGRPLQVGACHVYTSGREDERGDQMRVFMKLTIAGTMRARLRGLLGSSEAEGTLLLCPCSDIHTYGMRKPIDVAFVDAEGVVLDAMRDVGPGRRVRCGGAVATIERFSDGTTWLERGDRVGLSIGE